MESIINKLGLDKLAHMGIGALICACFAIVLTMQDLPCIVPWHTLWWVICGVAAAMLLQCFKEFVIDSKPDHCDTLATAIGCAAILIAFVLGILLNHATLARSSIDL